MEMITLNLIPKGIPPVCHASQYDKGRVIRCNLVDGLQGYVLSGETAVLNVIKPDNNIVTEALTATTGNSYIDIITTEQMCAVAGKNECEIRLTKGEVEVGTLNFIMQVEADVTTGGIESETVIHNLKTTISDMIKEEIEAISPEEELSGAMASFETHEIAPLVDCKVKIEAIQSGSGTPSPDNERPITGFTGANITNHGKNYLDTSTNVNGKALSATGVETSVPVACYTDLIKVVGGKKYTFGATSAIVDAWNRRIHGYDESGNWVQEIKNSNSQSYAVGTPFTMTFTVPSGISYVRISYYKDTNAQLEIGTTATDYEAYNRTTYPISWQTEAGTVYGGSLDVTSGVLTVTHKVIDMGSLTWNTVGMGGGRTGFKSTISDIELAPSATVVFNGICECYASLNENDVYLGNTGIATWGANTHDIAVYDTDRESLSGNDFKTAVTGSDLVYTLQTPVTYQLTPTEIKTILGVNNIWADTGDIDVVYHHELTARYVYFDNTGTDLTATNVEAAIKELWSRLQ